VPAHVVQKPEPSLASRIFWQPYDESGPGSRSSLGRTHTAMNHIIGQAELAAELHVSERELMEIANRGRLAFSVSTGRGLFILKDALPLWHAAVAPTCVGCDGDA
jgi:hypothetical protein